MAEFKIPKPVPMPSEESKPFWEGCQKQELLLQRCDDCGHYRFPPNILCPKCMSANYKWARSSGKAKVFTWQVTHQAFYPAWDTPFNVTIVELEEGPRMHSNIVGCNNEDIYMGMPVELVFEQIEDQDWYLPKFKPVSLK
ncbi:MAG: Zn-ribbon domain-containing OB-fold protein [Dehalococcoidia bacterium]